MHELPEFLDAMHELPEFLANLFVHKCEQPKMGKRYGPTAAVAALCAVWLMGHAVYSAHLRRARPCLAAADMPWSAHRVRACARAVSHAGVCGCGSRSSQGVLAAVVVVNTPGRVALLQAQHKPQAQHNHIKPQLSHIFSQPGYNPQHPKGLWGKGVPAEFVDDDYKLVKSLADVEQDLKQDTVLMGQLQVSMGQTPTKLRTARGQQLAVGGVDIEGGQGESDSIFGSHDDHSTYGVAGSGWQGAGNGEMPGEMWNPAIKPGGRRGGFRGSQQMRVARGQQLAVGGVDIEGGQGESDSIFGSHDDHSTYGVAGSGWQGAGNGEMPGEMWNPAIKPGGRRGLNLVNSDFSPLRQRGVQQLRQFVHPFGVREQSLAGSVPYPVSIIYV